MRWFGESLNMEYRVNLRSARNVELEQATQRWYLDSPKPADLEEGAISKLTIRGWLLALDDQARVELLLRKKGAISRFDFNQARPDVLKRILGETNPGHPRMQCGFVIDLTLDGNDCEIGFQIEGNQHWFATIEIAKPPKVLEGKHEYYFLSNDSNRSTEQFTGGFPIPDITLRKWEDYVESSAALRVDKQVRSAFLVAPSKEFVFPDYYPYVKGERTPITQLCELFAQRGESLIYPIIELTRSRELTYSRGDTHWTDYGALVAAEAVLKSLDMDVDLQRMVPKFVLRMAAGDLASKLVPPKKLPCYYADFAGAGLIPMFDNGIRNHGRIWVYERKDAKNDLSAILFGDSFSTNLVPWLSLAFRRMVYVHSAASIDREIIALEQPDIVILQTNSRFIVNAPHAHLSTREVIAGKMSTLSPAEKKVLLETLNKQPDEPYKFWMPEFETV